MLNIKSLDPNKIKIDWNPNKNTLISCVGYVTSNSVKTLFLLSIQIDVYIKEINGSKYWAIVPADKCKDTLTKYEELWNKIRDFITSNSNNLDNYGERYMKIKLNSVDNLPLKNFGT